MVDTFVSKCLRDDLTRKIRSNQAKIDERFAVPVKFVSCVVDDNVYVVVAKECGISVLSDDEYRKKIYEDD